MAFYPITMNQVKQIHKLRAEGYGIKTIASALGISKNTVKSYSGDKLYYVDRNTSKRVAVEVLLITLGYSNYTLAVAVRSQKKEDLVEGLVYLFSWLGAITAAIVPDNLKSAVTKADRYEPVINETFLDMAITTAWLYFLLGP